MLCYDQTCETIYKGHHSKVTRCFVGWIVLVSEHDKHSFIHSFIIGNVPHHIMINYGGWGSVI